MAGELILIVEDNEKNMKLMRDILRHHGYRIAEAWDGEDGVATALTTGPDLILMDIELPDIDGYAALARLREDPRTRRIPVCAVTAFAMAADRERGGRAGFDDYVPKPISVGEFPQRVGRLLERSRPEVPS